MAANLLWQPDRLFRPEHGTFAMMQGAAKEALVLKPDRLWWPSTMTEVQQGGNCKTSLWIVLKTQIAATNVLGCSSRLVD